jgi:hypothetical protein
MEAIKRVRDRIQDLLERLLDFGDRLHQQAREESDEFNSAQHRKDAELVSEARKEIWEQTNAMNVHSVDHSVHGNSAPVQTVKTAPQTQTVNISERTLAIIAFGFAIAAFVVSLWANSDNTKIRDELLRSERESRVLQQQVMDQSALLLREGIRQPGDLTNGPSGNLDYKPRN